MNLSARPGRGRLCRIEFGTGGVTPEVLSPQLVPHPRRNLTVGDALGEASDDAVKPVRKVDVVIPHTDREYATGAVLTLRNPAVARDLAAAFTRAAVMLEQEVPGSAAATVDLTPETLATAQDLTALA